MAKFAENIRAIVNYSMGTAFRQVALENISKFQENPVWSREKRRFFVAFPSTFACFPHFLYGSNAVMWENPPQCGCTAADGISHLESDYSAAGAVGSSAEASAAGSSAGAGSASGTMTII